MANVLVDPQSLTAIANSIRSKLGVQTTYKPSEMADAIDRISGGGITPTGTKSITANGTYDVTEFASAEVAVPTSGGGVDSGTVTGDGTKTISITTSKQCSNVVVLCLSSDMLPETTWHCLGVMGVAGEHHDFSIYNNSNTFFSRNQPTITFSANAISISNLKYTTFNAVTYHWYAW